MASKKDSTKTSAKPDKPAKPAKQKKPAKLLTPQIDIELTVAYVGFGGNAGLGMYFYSFAPDVVTVSVPSTSVVMMRGSRGPRVAALQRGLLAVFPSYAAPIKSSGGADGIFGDGTDKVVREFQRRSGLSVDGIVGPQTLAKLAACGIRI